MLVDGRRLHIKSDSQYVVNGFARHAKWRLRGWEGDHADLWNQVSGIIDSDPARVIVSKVSAHMTWADVRRGRLSAQDKIGNAWADRLAVAGAEEHARPDRLVAQVKERRGHALKLHKETVDILSERDDSVKLLGFMYDKRLPAPTP